MKIWITAGTSKQTELVDIARREQIEANWRERDRRRAAGNELRRSSRADTFDAGRSYRAAGGAQPLGKFGAASKPRVLDEAERAAIEQRLIADGKLIARAGGFSKLEQRAFWPARRRK